MKKFVCISSFVGAALLSGCTGGAENVCNIDLNTPSLIVELDEDFISPQGLALNDGAEPVSLYKVGISQEGDGQVVFECFSGNSQPTVLGEDAEWRGQTDPSELAHLADCGDESFTFKSDPVNPVVTVQGNLMMGAARVEPEYQPYEQDEGISEECAERSRSKTATVSIEAQ